MKVSKGLFHAGGLFLNSPGVTPRACLHRCDQARLEVCGHPLQVTQRCVAHWGCVAALPSMGSGRPCGSLRERPRNKGAVAECKSHGVGWKRKEAVL